MRMMDSEEAYEYSMSMIDEKIEKMTIHNQKIHTGMIQRIMFMEKRLERLESLHDREEI